MKGNRPTIKAQAREKTGTRYTQRYRQAGRLPAVIYGHGAAPVSVLFEAETLVPQIEAGEKVFNLEMSGAAGQMLLLKEVQFDYLGTNIIHADFARVDINERVRTKVHVELTGEAKGLKTAGAILMHPTSELEIECRVADLPDVVRVDISELEMDQSITADKVKLPSADMKLITDPHSIVAQIVEQKEEIVAEATVVAAEGAAEPEVIGEKERLEKLAAEGAAPGAKPAAGAAAAKPGAPAAKPGAAGAAAAKPAAPKK